MKHVYTITHDKDYLDVLTRNQFYDNIVYKNKKNAILKLKEIYEPILKESKENSCYFTRIEMNSNETEFTYTIDNGYNTRTETYRVHELDLL